MYNLSRGFQVTDDGIVIENGAGIISGTGLPLDIVMNDPCYYLRSNGEIWYNTGGAAWQLAIANVTTTVFNNTGSTIPKLSVVYINGGQGDQPTVALAQANSEAASSKTFGVVVADIADQSIGTVMAIGKLTGVNTEQFNFNAPSGDVNGVSLWLSPTIAGGLQTDIPQAPNHSVFIGQIVRTHPNDGSIEIRIQNGYELKELHDVKIVDVQNGQVLKYNSLTSTWDNILLTKNDVGLDQVDNTSDADKPISTATQAALDLKADQTDLETLSNTVDANKAQIDSVFNDTSEPTGFLNQTESVLSWDDATRTLSVAPAATSFSIYLKGVKYTFSSTLTKQIPDTSGSYFFYVDNTGTLNYLTAFNTSLFSSVAYCAYVLWDENDNKAITFAEERHSIILDSATHSNLHLSRGTQLVSGAAIGFTTTGDGTLAADAQVSISDAVVLDEDIRAVITNSATPTNRFEQILSPIAEIPIYYRINSTWRKTTATQYPIKFGTTRAQYNKNTAGVWSLEDASADNKFLVSYIFVTTNIKEPVIALMGQDEYTDLADAKARAAWSNITFGDLPAQEIKLAHIAFFETSSTYTNAVKSAIRAVNDLRFGTDREVSATSLNTAHANLSGLLQDDHTQYLNEFRGDARYYTQTFLDSALAGKQPTGDYITALTGDVTASGPGSSAATLSDTGVAAGTYNLVTVDAKGRVTTGTNGTTTRWTYFTTLVNNVTVVTYTTVAELTSATLQPGIYYFSAHGAMRSTQAQSGVGIRLGVVSGTVTTLRGKWNIAQGLNGTAHDYSYDQLAETTNITSVSVQTINTDFLVEGSGVFRVTSAAVVAIQIRTETAGQTATLQADAILQIAGI